MKVLKVSIEIDGVQHSVGTIEGEDSFSASFCYSRSYLPIGVPVSNSLPLQEEPFSPQVTRSFFEGLLPEGFSRRSVAQWIRADEQDYLTILAALGKECLGALMIEDSSSNETAERSYQKLSTDQVRRLASEGATRSAEIVVSSHLSLTGASGKAGLYLDEKSGTWYQPIGAAPSTHIVKQSHIRLRNIIENEQLALRPAAKLGIPAADSFVVNTGAYAEDEILLAAKRYDRDLEHARFTVDGLLVPLRLHQEDMAQALGISSAEKYEKDGDQYLKKIFKLLRNTVSNPMRDQLRLLDILIFDVLIGNTDNHIKNLSLLYGSNLREISLAPAYDLLSTAIYRESTPEMSIAIAGVRDWNSIGRETFLKASDEIGIAPRIIANEYDRLNYLFRDALQSAAQELETSGLKHCRELAGRIIAMRRDNSEKIHHQGQ